MMRVWWLVSCAKTSGFPSDGTSKQQCKHMAQQICRNIRGEVLRAVPSVKLRHLQQTLSCDENLWLERRHLHPQVEQEANASEPAGLPLYVPDVEVNRERDQSTGRSLVYIHGACHLFSAGARGSFREIQGRPPEQFYSAVCAGSRFAIPVQQQQPCGHV